MGQVLGAYWLFCAHTALPSLQSASGTLSPGIRAGLKALQSQVSHLEDEIKQIRRSAEKTIASKEVCWVVNTIRHYVLTFSLKRLESELVEASRKIKQLNSEKQKLEDRRKLGHAGFQV